MAEESNSQLYFSTVGAQHGGLFFDQGTSTWMLLDANGNVLWRGFNPSPIASSYPPLHSSVPSDHTMPLMHQHPPLTLSAHASITPAPYMPAYHSIAQVSLVSGARLDYRVEVLEQSIYDRGLSSDLRLPDIAFGNFRLRDALRSDFRSLADPEGIAWPEGYQTPQKLAIVVYFRGYDKHSRQYNVLRQHQALRLPPTRSKIAHNVALVVQSCIIETRDPAKYPTGPLGHNGREVTLEDLVLMDVQHASRGSLQPTIGVIVPV